ncbi:MAG: hypothetical protein EA400_17240 [Chromatiaceae bacterium]|nr:MAG: hypothetical protein EA400_17240 [Chromatiaceae bacterium]
MKYLLRFRPAPFPEFDPEPVAAAIGTSSADTLADVGATGGWDDEFGQWDAALTDAWAEVAGELSAADPLRGEVPRRRSAPRRPRATVRQPLPRAAAQAPVPVPRPPPACPFAPSRHGFRFTNDFTLPAALTRLLTTRPLGPILSRLGIPVGAGAYGLCGGMSTLALDHFRFNVPIPTTASAPATGSSLYNRLVSRQLDSLKLNLASIGPGLGAPIRKFADWMVRPDRGRGGVAALTAAEFDDVRSSLARGGQLILGLVLTSRAHGGALTDNHQVLARCLRRVAPDFWDILIYDPNFPRCDDARLEVRLTDGEALTRKIVACPSAANPTTGVRGFFIMPYRATRPRGRGRS